MRYEEDLDRALRKIRDAGDSTVTFASAVLTREECQAVMRRLLITPGPTK